MKESNTKRPKAIIFYSNNMGIQIEIPQKLITEALIEGGDKLEEIMQLARLADAFSKKYMDTPIITETDEELPA